MFLIYNIYQNWSSSLANEKTWASESEDCCFETWSLQDCVEQVPKLPQSIGLLPKCSPVLLLNAGSTFLNRIQGFILYTKNILYTSWQQKVQYFDQSWTTLSSAYRRNIKNKHSAHTHTHLTAVSHLNHHHFKPGLRTQSQSPLLGVLDPDHLF